MGDRSNRIGEEVLTCTHNQCFEQNYLKYQIFSIEIFKLLQMKNIHIAWASFRNEEQDTDVQLFLGDVAIW